ncbi:HAD family hydrolase [Paenibacillus planticolens]|uniref:Haloacid dehalogenase n=1 Tax=Paenibacillus planticolens TaxID=2654976 RepID=A0ABX1ZKI3_9BACL|nr:HAD family hydrolase [Paenibacillus planticolens]NOV00341.1 haloacid dehalogenase [Paenibacillus planticolens]
MQSITDFGPMQSAIEHGAKEALIDIDNTLAKAKITDLYMWMKRKEFKSILLWRGWLIYFAICWGPVYLLLDFIHRDWFQRAFYRRFHRYSLCEIETNSVELFESKYKQGFIRYTHDLIFYLKENNVNVTLLSTNITPIVRLYGQYFDVPYICLRADSHETGLRVNLDELKDFKINAAMEYDPLKTIAVADSKHDLPVLNYVQYPFIVSNNKKKWMAKLRHKVILISEDLK